MLLKDEIWVVYKWNEWDVKLVRLADYYHKLVWSVVKDYHPLNNHGSWIPMDPNLRDHPSQCTCGTTFMACVQDLIILFPILDLLKVVDVLGKSAKP